MLASGRNNMAPSPNLAAPQLYSLPPLLSHPQLPGELRGCRALQGIASANHRGSLQDMLDLCHLQHFQVPELREWNMCHATSHSRGLTDKPTIPLSYLKGHRPDMANCKTFSRPSPVLLRDPVFPASPFTCSLFNYWGHLQTGSQPIRVLHSSVAYSFPLHKRTYLLVTSHLSPQSHL